MILFLLNYWLCHRRTKAMQNEGNIAQRNFIDVKRLHRNASKRMCFVYTLYTFLIECHVICSKIDSLNVISISFLFFFFHLRDSLRSFSFSLTQNTLQNAMNYLLGKSCAKQREKNKTDLIWWFIWMCKHWSIFESTSWA